MDAKIAPSYTSTIENGMISDPSNILEESSHPLQGTGTPAPALQPLIPPDDDYTHVPAPTPLILPHELVERIFLLLDTKSVLRSRLVNREFNAIIQSSTSVQYYLACEAAGVIDNPQSPLSYGERLEALKQREDAWRKLKPAFETTIKTNDLPSALYDLSAGNLFRLDKNRKELHYCRLPSSPQDSPQWFRILGYGPSWSGSIVGMGMAVYEHDLVVSVISDAADDVDNADMPQHTLYLVLVKLSTGEYHPLARYPKIQVQRSFSALPYISVKIVGDNLALVVHDRLPHGSKLFIFDWKTGHRRLKHHAPWDAYENSIPVFVSPEILLVPNRIYSCFEIWHLFPSLPNLIPPGQILSLETPVTYYHNIASMESHGELGPFLHSMPYFPPRPFFPSSESSIVTINLLLQSFDNRPAFRKAYKLVIHRRALLDIIQEWTSPSHPEQRSLPTWPQNKVTVDKVADPDDGSVRLAAQSELCSLVEGDLPQTPDYLTLANSPTSPTSHKSADSSSPDSASSTPQIYSLLLVQWANWGPPVSRWFRVNKTHQGWNNQSIGQRFAFVDPNPSDTTKCIVGVADFNLHNVEMMAQLGREGQDNGGNEGKNEENEELEILDHKGGFSEEVCMGLKCVVHHAPGEYDFDRVLMDEERLLGFKIHPEGRAESIKVLYFG
ncbi:hypothetical protein M378DRAFT_804991 [Amanita muscaria Koide BX008]|uniref:F-box domain-containing protein n=1 Tax=Amanita muscaria (strain Koide BX008) TaxID=946122 RepID=A0A0C2WKN1_AMAMK|nr:hypothetical protein M378DRAFT_804991 [Amanita muscaria Koide BX008]